MAWTVFKLSTIYQNRRSAHPKRDDHSTVDGTIQHKCGCRTERKRERHTRTLIIIKYKIHWKYENKQMGKEKTTIIIQIEMQISS